MILRLKYKLWFIFDLPAFVKHNHLKKGLELGAKGGRSMFWMLIRNKTLHLVGIDIWEVLNSKTYKNNDKNELICKRRIKRFKDRVKLYKGNVNDLVDEFEDNYFDFIYFDLFSPITSSTEDLIKVLDNYLPKIKKGGYLIGRDLHKPPFKEVLLNHYGIIMKPCIIKARTSVRLKYYKIE